MRGLPIPNTSIPTSSIPGVGGGRGYIPLPKSDPVSSWVGRPTTASGIPSIGGTIVKGLSLGLLIVQGSLLILDFVGRAGANRWRDNLLKQINGGNSSQSSEKVVDTNVGIYLLRNDGFKVPVYRDDDPSFPGLGNFRVSDIPNLRFYANDQEAINNGWFFIFRGEGVARPYFIPPVRYEDAQGNQLASDLKTEQRGEPATKPFPVPQVPAQPQREIVLSPISPREPERDPKRTPSVSPFSSPVRSPLPLPFISPVPSPSSTPVEGLANAVNPLSQFISIPATQTPATQTPATQIYPNGRTNDDYLKLKSPFFPVPSDNKTPFGQPINKLINDQSTKITTNLIDTGISTAINLVNDLAKKSKCCDPELSSISVKKFDRCENGAPVFVSENISVLKGTEEQNTKLFEEIAGFQALQCNETACYAAVPEWWQIRPEGKRPQVVLKFCAKEGDGKYGPPKYPITIPHPKITQKMMSSPLQSYKKGNFEGELKLADNSKVIVNCINKAEAERVLSIIKGMIKDKLLEGSTVKFSERGGNPVKQQEMAIRFATYFEKGIEDSANYKWKSIFELPK